MTNRVKSVLIIGGASNLGRALVSSFQSSWKVANLDITPNEQAHLNLQAKELPKAEDVEPIINSLTRFSGKLDAILCISGAEVMGSFKDSKILNDYEYLRRASVIPPMVGAHLATKLLNENGLLVFAGHGRVQKTPTPQSLVLGVTKTAAHALAMNMACRVDIPKTSTVVTLLHKMLDTPENRKLYPFSDFETWAKTEQIACLVKNWADGINKPINGSLVHFSPKDGQLNPSFEVPEFYREENVIQSTEKTWNATF